MRHRLDLFVPPPELYLGQTAWQKLAASTRFCSEGAQQTISTKREPPRVSGRGAAAERRASRTPRLEEPKATPGGTGIRGAASRIRTGQNAPLASWTTRTFRGKRLHTRNQPCQTGQAVQPGQARPDGPELPGQTGKTGEHARGLREQTASDGRLSCGGPNLFALVISCIN